MEHKNRWLNRTRLTLAALESRMQPGSLLTTGLEMPLDGVEHRPERPSSRPESMAVTRPQTEDTVVLTKQTASPGTSGLTQVSQSSQSSSSSTGLTQTAAGQVVHSGVAAPQKANSFVAPTMQGQGSTMRVGDTVRQRHEATVTQAPTAKLVASPLKLTETNRPDRSFSSTDCSSDHSGTKAPVWASYDSAGTTRADGVQDVATAGTGVNAGSVFTVGYQGRNGTIRRYDEVTGACTGLINIPPDLGAGANRNRVTGIAVDLAGDTIFVVNNHTLNNTTHISTDIRAYDANALGAALAVATYTPTAGINVLMQDIGIDNQVGDEDVFIIGTVDDPSAAYNILADISLDDTLTTENWNFGVDYGVDTNGFAVDGDATGQHFTGANLDPDGTAHRPFWDAWDAGMTTEIWGGGWYFDWTGGVAAEHPDNGITGVYHTPGGLGISGALADSALVGGNAIGAHGNVDPTTGIPGAYLQGWSTTGDLVFTANVIHPSGNQITSGAADDEGDGIVTGDISEFDPVGGYTAFFGIGDPSGATLTRGFGIDNNPIGVALGGETRVSSGFTPALTGCDATFGGSVPSDGWVVGWTVPT